jgi:hypothetical protein
MPPRRKANVVAAGTQQLPVKPPRPGPKKISGGNSICDREWIADMLADGSLRTIEPDDRPAGFLYDVLYRWDGNADDINPEFFEFYRPLRGVSERPRQCNGTAYIRDHRGGYVVDAEWIRIRRLCLGRPARGTNVCHAHGASIPQVKAAAQRALAEAAEIVALRLVGLTDMADERNEAIAHKDRISAANSVLDRAGIKGGVEVEISTPGFKRVLEKMFGADDDANE